MANQNVYAKISNKTEIKARKAIYKKYLFNT